jgi:outer membrane protein TolC
MNLSFWLRHDRALSNDHCGDGCAAGGALWSRSAYLAAGLFLALCFLPTRVAAQATTPSSAGTAVQIVHLPQPTQPGAPETITIEVALARALKSDATYFAAARDAKSAHEDSVQAKAALLPNFQYSTQFLNTQGDGSTTIGRYVTNDGVHVYRAWLMMHQDLSAPTLLATPYKRAQTAEAVAYAKAEIARRGLNVAVTKFYYTLVDDQRKYETAKEVYDRAQEFYKDRTTAPLEPPKEEKSDADKAADSAKAAAESAKDAADSAKGAADSAKDAAESARKATSPARKAAPAKKGAPAINKGTEPAKEEGESAQGGAETAQGGGEPAGPEAAPAKEADEDEGAEKEEGPDPRDALKAEIQLRQQQQLVQEAELAVEDARLDLSVVLFTNPNENFNVVDDLDKLQELPPFSEVQAMAEKQNPDLKAAMETVRGAQLDLKAAKMAYFGSFTVDVDEGIEANQFALHSVNVEFPEKGVLPNLGYFLTANWTIPVWNWGALNSKIKQTTYKLDEARAALSQSQRGDLDELYAAYNEAQVSREALTRLEHTMHLAEESLRLADLPTKGEPIEVDQVIDAENMLTTTRGSYYDGLVRYRMALANLQLITGKF